MTFPQGFVFPDMTIGGANIYGFLLNSSLTINITFGTTALQHNSEVAIVENSGVSTFVYYNLMTIVETDTSIELVYYGNITINATINTPKRLTIVSFNGSITLGDNTRITANDIIFICPEGRFSNAGALTAAPGTIFISANTLTLEDMNFGSYSSSFILANKTFFIPGTTNSQINSFSNKPLIITSNTVSNGITYQIGETGTPSN